MSQFKYHPKCAKLGISQLCFADDLLLFSRGDLESVSCLNQCFHKFSQSSGSSGLQANLGKSCIYFGRVANDVQQSIKQKLGFNHGDLPFKYLGIPLSTKKLTNIQWAPLIEKIVTRISCWTARKLSYGGRVQLVQSVLFGIQAY